MKIISVKQPWASLIIHGARNIRTGTIEFKNIENRDWRTHHRGPTIIHASQNDDREATAEELRRSFDVLMPKSMSRGGVIGIVDIIDCVDDHPSKWFSGEYGFVLKNPRRLQFQRWLGQLGIREAPRELLSKLKPERRPHD